jgi:apolipoprotein D and lipocalin family protein
MRGVILAALMGLALFGCTKSTPFEPVNRRDPKALISSASLFEPNKFAGSWRVAGSYTPGCLGAEQVWKQASGGWDISGIDCSGPAPAALSGHADLIGPGGRILPKGGYGDEPLWVLWIDQDYRVAVLGAPSGHHAVILTRPGMARGDLVRAAKEVLDFNGFSPNGLAR